MIARTDHRRTLAGRGPKLTAPAATREIWSPGQIADVCLVSAKTAQDWIDSGRLKGHRIPGSLQRRVRRADLLDFLRANGYPTDAITGPAFFRVAVVGDPLSLPLPVALGTVVDSHSSIVSLALWAHEHTPDVIVFGPPIGDALHLLRLLRELPETTPRAAAVIVEGDQHADPRLKAFDQVFHAPASAEAVAAWVARVRVEGRS